MKATDLREKNPSQLKEMLLGLARELFDLRMQKGVGEVQVKSHHFKRIRSSIARIKTILTEKAKTV